MSEREVIALAAYRAEVMRDDAVLDPPDSPWGRRQRAVADAILAALDAAGKAVVPVEPTREMDEAAHDAIAMEIVVVGEGIEIAEGAPARIWRAMLAAAKEGEP
jgi:hypothetical protein